MGALSSANLELTCSLVNSVPKMHGHFELFKEIVVDVDDQGVADLVRDEMLGLEDNPSTS